jgi:hypothetical protein
VIAGCVSSVLGGCSVRKRPAIPWATAVQVRPNPQAHAAPASGISEDTIPELQFELASFSVPVITIKSSPPRPRVSAPPSANAAGETDKLEAPMISPQRTPQETAADQEETKQSLAIVEKNLASTRGKKLNAAQSDLASKVRGFLKDAREAAGIGDWSHARSLAKKAQVLSEELASSL